MSLPILYDDGLISPVYANEEQRTMSKPFHALDAALLTQRTAEAKVKASTATLTTAVASADGLMKQNTDAFAQTDRILAEAIAHHAKMTAYFKAEKEKYERDAADEQGALKRILVAAEQEKAAADAEITSCRDAIAAHNAEKEERAAAARATTGRSAAAAEAATRRARELREHEAAARARRHAGAAAAAAAYELQLATKAAVRRQLATKASAPPVARPATRSTTRPIITEQTKQALLIRQGGLCGKPSTGHGCGQQLPISRADGEPRPIFDIDHILPVSDWQYGGDCHNIDNLQALCPNCHAIKTRHTDRGRVVG